MNINDLAQATGLSREQIRYYETHGLIDCQFWSERKEFDEHDVNRLQKIVLLRKMGFSLSAIRLILDDTFSLEEQLTKQLVSLEAEKEKFDGAYNLCKAMLEEIGASDETVQMEHLNVEQWMEFVGREEAAGHTFVDCWQDIETGFDFGLLYPFFVKDLRKKKHFKFLTGVVGWVLLCAVFGLIKRSEAGIGIALAETGVLFALFLVMSLPHYLLGKKHPRAVSWVFTGLCIGLLLILFATLIF